MKNWLICGAVLFLLLASSGQALAQWIELPATGSKPEHLQDRTMLAGQSGLGPLMAARLVDKDANARQHRAVVEVQTDGVHMTNAASVNYAPKLDQAHIQYRLDSGDVINSTSKTMTFNHLSPGKHQIWVALAGNNNQPACHETTLTVYIP